MSRPGLAKLFAAKYDVGMTAAKIAVSVPRETLAAVEKRVARSASRAAPSSRRRSTPGLPSRR